MKTSQSFPFYPTDFIFGTMMMTPAQVGGYIRALCYQWESGGFPVGLQEQKIITGCTEDDLGVIVRKFTRKGSVLTNQKLEEVRLDREHYIEIQRINGKKGGRPKGKATGNPSLSQPLTQTKAKKSLPSPLPFPSPILPGERGEDAPDTRHHEITSQIKERFLRVLGREMTFNGKDAKDLKTFLAGWNGSTNDFWATAEQAWKRSSNQYASGCKKSCTLSGLCQNWGLIEAEIAQDQAAQKPKREY